MPLACLVKRRGGTTMSTTITTGHQVKDRRKDRAWLLLLGLLVGLITWSAATPSGAEPATAAAAGCTGAATENKITLPSGATAAVCDGPTATTSAGPLSIVLSKTVGTDRNTCAQTTEITVTSAVGDVVYCYKVTNTGSVTATEHDLVDDKLGTLLSDYQYSLAPGASTFATAAASLAGQGSVVVNTATWTATDGVNTADSSAQAKVNVIDGPTAPSVTAVAYEGAAKATWTVPSSTGGQVITGYSVTPFDNGVAATPITTAANVTTLDFPELTNGHTYRFDVAATTANGDGLTGSSNEVTPQWWRPWTSANKAVTEIYTWLTGRAPTTAQLTAFVTAANTDGKLPGDLVATLRDGTDATANVDPVIRLYSAYFLRPPDKAGLNFWLDRRRGGSTLSKISDTFAASSEFKNRYGSLTNAAYVELVYDNVLDRAPDPGGLAYWTAQLDQKKKTRGQVMLSFSDSNEYKTKRAVYVDAVSLYVQFLDRSPTKVQVSDLETVLGTATIAEVVREFVHDPSFDARAG